MKFIICVAVLCGFLTLTTTQSPAAETVQCPVTKDNSIVLVDGEWTLNAGSQGRIRIKANQHIVVMSFDLSALAGKHVNKATLVCSQGEQTISGLSMSTIATRWDENRSNGLTAGIDGIDDWGYPGAKFPAVIGGNGFTPVHQVESKVDDGTYYWDVPPDMVHALMIGVAHGLALHEHDSDVGRNPTIFAREQSGKKPYLIVEVDDQASVPPLPATDLQIEKVDSKSARLSLTSPPQGFAYDVLIDGQPLPRHNIPLVLPGTRQTIPIRDLPTSIESKGTHEIKVVTLNRRGEKSAAAVVRSEIVQTRHIESPDVAISRAQSPAVKDLCVLPITDKFDSAGKAVGELPDDYRIHNTVYNGQRVHCHAAAGEIVGFQILLRGREQATVKVELEAFNPRIDLWQAHYVPVSGRMIPDPLLPMPQFLKLTPDVDQVVVVDIFVPFDAPPGLQKGMITVSDGRVVPIEIDILPFSLPKQATFFCEMNGYGLPDHVNDFYQLQQVAYDHRVHANILHYSHQTAAQGARKSNLDMRLRSGRRMDNSRYDNIQPDAAEAYWTDFEEAFGPYIDGSLFNDGHRGPVPAPGFYLTFHESWPLNCRPYFNGNLDAFKAFSDHPEYARTYVNVLRDFRRLADSKGWTETGFQVYFNNKGSLHETQKAPWILDEPAGFWDYRALKYYGELTDQSRSADSKAQIQYRIDISRPEFCRGQLDGRPDLWVVSTWAFQNYRRLVTDRIELNGLKAWIYGTSSHVDKSNRNIQAWALDAWKCGASGIVPWQTIDKSGNALKEADQLGLFIFDRNEAGETVIRHSLRLKAYRESQQLIEYLNILQERENWSLEQRSLFVDRYINLEAQVNKANEADAGTTAFHRLSPSGLELLKIATAQLLRGESKTRVQKRK